MGRIGCFETLRDITEELNFQRYNKLTIVRELQVNIGYRNLSDSGGNVAVGCGGLDKRHWNALKSWKFLSHLIV